MKILFFTHYFPPEGNAPATRTYEHCKRWCAAGHEVTVLTCAPNVPNGIVYDGYKNKLYHRETMDGIEVIRLWTFLAPNKGFLKRILNYLSYMMITTIYACLFKGKVDLVVATSPQFFCGWAGVLCHFLRRWPFILEIRDIWPESILTVGAMKKGVAIRLLEKMEVIMYRAANHIVAVGQGYKDKIIERGVDENKISVVYNGVSLQDFVRVDDFSKILEKYNSSKRFVCSYIGTIGMAHGLEVILKAAEKLKDDGDHSIVFWIVGDGARREYLESEALNKQLDNIVFTGRLDKNKMPEIISASSASLVHLKGTELFGTVVPSKIFEFMAMNVPIIMGVKGEALTHVMNSGYGVEMKPDDPESLIDCIKTIKELQANINSRPYVAENFNRDVLANDMFKIMERVVKE